MSTIEVVVGMQFGSEGKGHVTAQRVQMLVDGGIDVWNVRVAGPNAGHCVIDPITGYKYKFQALPVGAAFGARCVIAAGSEVDLNVLEREMRWLELNNRSIELFVDEQATLLTQAHIDEETSSNLNARTGSTAHGIGAARAKRIWREAEIVGQDETAIARIANLGGVVGDTQKLLRAAAEHMGKVIIIEGTQGYGLGLHAGHYPQCTSSNARAIDFLSMTGLTPWTTGVSQFMIWGATRVFPIRVAGNSGELKGETTWEDLGLEAEHTTVTKKVRRVGEWDGEMVREAVRANGADCMVLAVTMSDQKFPKLEGKTGMVHIESLDEDVKQWVEAIEIETGAKVGMITTSEKTAFYLVTGDIIPQEQIEDAEILDEAPKPDNAEDN